MQKRWMFLGLGILLVCGVMFFPASKPDHFTIGVVQYTKNNLTTLAGFKEGMASGGYKEGMNVRYVVEGPAKSKEELEPLLKRVLAEKPDLLFVSPTPAARVAKRLTAGLDVPVVFAPVNDPVAAKVVSTPDQPEANITGIRLSSSEGERLISLKQVVPSLKRVFVPHSPKDKSAQASVAALQQVAPALGVQIVKKPFSRDVDVLADASYVPDNIDAIFLPREGLVMSRIRQFAKLCFERKLPLSTPRYRQVELGALTGYGFVGFEIGRQASRLARKILEGAEVKDVPVEASHDYLFVNLETAQRIGVAVPDEVLQKADYLVHSVVE